MNIGAYAKAKAEAIAEIGRKTGIDLSSGGISVRTSDPKILELYRLKKIAEGLPEPSGDGAEMINLEDALEIIEGTKGVGPALTAKIAKALRV